MHAHFEFCCIYSVCLHNLVKHTARLPPKNTQPSCELASTEVTCIASWKDLFYIFQKEGRRTPLFPTSGSLPPLLLIHIHTDARNVSDVYNTTNYCKLSDSQGECAMIAAYSQSICEAYPGALLLSVSLAIVGDLSAVHHWQHNTLVEKSWTLPMPFCSGYYDYKIAKDFVHYGVSKLHTLYFMQYIRHACGSFA